MAEGLTTEEEKASAAGAAEWFYDDGTQPRGPFTLKAIGQLARAGVVRPDVPIAREGVDGWRALSEVTAGAIAKKRVPAVLPPGPDPHNLSFQVQLGGLRSPSSHMGFVWGATLRLSEDGSLMVSGRRQLGVGSRILWGILALIVLVPLAIFAIEFTAGMATGPIESRIQAATNTAGGTTLWVGALRYLMAIVGTFSLGLMLISILMIPLFVVTRCVARRGGGRFTIPEGAVASRKVSTVTMPLLDERGRLIKAARITFVAEDEAARFMAAITGQSWEEQPEEAS